MGVDEALDMAETWQALPDANGAAHVLAAGVRRVLKLHERVDLGAGTSPRWRCGECVDPYPCPTVRALDGGADVMDEIDEALRLADGLDLDDGQWIVDALAAEVRRLRDERDAALNLLEGYDAELTQRLRDQMAFDREEGR